MDAENKYFDGDPIGDPIDLQMKEFDEDIIRIYEETKEEADEELAKDVTNLLRKHRDNFRRHLIGEGAAKFAVTPTPVKTDQPIAFSHRAREYSGEELQALQKILKRFLQYGMIVRCQAQNTSSPVLMVKKPNGKGWRMVLDLRKANQLVEALAPSAVHLSHVRHCLTGSTIFSIMDMTDGYWQIELDSRGSTLYSFNTPTGSFRLTRLPQGAKNSATIFQQCMNQVAGKYLYGTGNGIIPYLDDLLVYAKTKADMITVLSYLFGQLKKFNMKIKLAKSSFGLSRVKWVGYDIQAKGITQPESRIKALLALRRPENGAELSTFIGALNYIRSWLGPQIAHLCGPINELKKEATKRAGSAKASKLRRIPLNWTEAAIKSFQDIKALIGRECLALAHPDPLNHDFHLYTDACDIGYGSILCQKPKNSPDDTDNYQILGFTSGRFTETQRRWSTFDQEAFAIVDAFIKYSIYIAGVKVKLHTDHRNLVYVFHPDKFASKRQTSNRVERWRIFLAQFQYEIVHVAGIENEWADLLSRWWPHENTDNRAKVQINAVSESSTQNRIIIERFRRTHARLLGGRISRFWTELLEKCDTEAENGKLFEKVPAHWKEQAIITLHVTNGHLQLPWESMGISSNEARKVLKFCRFCQPDKRMNKMPLGKILHGTRFGEVLHADYMKIENDYVLVIVDDLTRKILLGLSKSPSASFMARMLLNWRAQNGLRTHAIVRTDNGSHFTARLIKEVCEKLNILQQFSVSYSPWTNGTVERTNRTVLRILRTLKSQYRTGKDSYPTLLAAVADHHNNVPLARWHLSPNQLSLGKEIGNNPANMLPQVIIDNNLSEPIEPQVALKAFQDLSNELLVIQDMRSAENSRLRALSKKKHNAKYKAKQYSPGEWVRFASTKPRQKDKIHWLGPAQVVKPILHSNSAYILELLDGTSKTVHCQRMIPYCGPEDFEPTKDDIEQFRFDRGEYEIQEFGRLWYNELTNQYELEVRWLGFDDTDKTYEPVESLYKTNKEMVSNHLRTECGDSGIQVLEALQQRN